MRYIATLMLSLLIGFAPAIGKESPKARAKSSAANDAMSAAIARDRANLFTPAKTQIINRKLSLLTPDTSLWFRYYQAGEDAALANKPAQAQQYWMSSLTELEKVRTFDHDDIMLAIKISALEKYLTDSYASECGAAGASAEDDLKIRQQQTNALYRVARLNDKLVSRRDLLWSKSRERYIAARQEYDKALKANKTKQLETKSN